MEPTNKYLKKLFVKLNSSLCDILGTSSLQSLKDVLFLFV